MSLRMGVRRFGAVVALAALLSAGCAAQVPEAPPVRSTPIPAPVPPPPTPEELRHEQAVSWVDAASTRERVGAVIMASFPSTDAAELHELMSVSGLGGFIIMGANVPGTPDELAGLVAALTVDPQLPPLVAIDEEGGVVTRLPWDTFPGADVLRFGTPADVEGAFSERGGMLADAGITVNFGIVADIAADPGSFIYWRTLGDDPATASSLVRAAVTGERGHVASTLKHFPGHGAASGDSHALIPSTDLSFEHWLAHEARPFAAGIDAGAALLMFGHLAYTAVAPRPASLSPEWYAIARDELGFAGVTITDDLGMLQDSGLPEYHDPIANTVAAVTAGADIALIVRGIDAPGIVALVDGVTAAADRGDLPADRLRDAAIRATELRLRLAE